LTLRRLVHTAGKFDDAQSSLTKYFLGLIMQLFSKLGLCAVLGSLFVASAAQADCRFVKYRDVPIAVKFLGVPITAGKITFTARGCFSPSENKANPLKINSTTWTFVDSATGSLFFGPGKKINQGASGGTVAKSWADMEYKVAGSGLSVTIAGQSITLPGDLKSTIRIESQMTAAGNCRAIIGGEVKASGTCASFAP
jgi:hypothetical protein